LDRKALESRMNNKEMDKNNVVVVVNISISSDKNPPPKKQRESFD